MPGIRTRNHRVVVIGAGIVGSAIGFHLARSGANVTLIDAGEPGCEATAVSFAWANSRDKNPRHYHDLNRRSIDMWGRFSRLLDLPDALTWGGELRWAATPRGAEQMAARVETLQSWGYPTYLIDDEELQRLEPELVPGPVSAASYSEIDGHVDAVSVARRCARLIEQLPADRPGRVWTGTRIKEFQRDDRGVTSVLTNVATEDNPDGRLQCETVVIACGPQTADVAALAGLKVPMYDTFGANLLTGPIPHLLKTAAVIHSPRDAEPKVHVRQMPDGRFVIQGSTHGRMRSESLGRNREERATMVAAARRYLPGLQDVPVEEVRRGRRPIPKDGLPIIGYTKEVPNVYLATMHSGVTLAALVGEFAALEILSGTRIDLLRPYRLERFAATA